MAYKEIMDELDRIREEIYKENAAMPPAEVAARRTAKGKRVAEELGLTRVTGADIKRPPPSLK